MDRPRNCFSMVMVVDPYHFLHVPYIHAATLGCITSLGLQCISLSLQRDAIKSEFEALLLRQEIDNASPELVRWGKLPLEAGSSWRALEAALAPWMRQQGASHKTLIWIGWLDWMIGSSRKAPCLPGWHWNWAGAYYHLPPSFDSGCQWSQEWLKERLLPFWRFCTNERCQGLAVFNEYWLNDTQGSMINRLFRSGGCKLLQFPDVASSHAAPSGVPSYGASDKIRIGLFGQLSWRKGLTAFLRASCLAERSNPQLEFLLAGELQLQHFSEDDQLEIISILHNPPKNLHYKSGVVRDELAFNAMIQQADVLHIAYNQFAGSSNLLTKAVSFEIPVIAYPGYLVGRRVRDFSLGWVTAAETQQAYLDVVLSINREMINQVKTSARWDDYHSQHDLTRLRSMFEKLLDLG